MDKLRTEIGKIAHSEEDVLTYAMFPEIGKDFLTNRSKHAVSASPENTAPTGTAERRARPTEFNVTLHGEPYHIKITGTGHRQQDNRPFYMTVNGIPEEVLVEILDEIPAADGDNVNSRAAGGSQRPRATRPGDITTSMPGTIIDVLVAVGDAIEAGTPVLITEAMKMETEIQSPLAGKVSAINVSKGDSVNPDETLVEIESES